MAPCRRKGRTQLPASRSSSRTDGTDGGPRPCRLIRQTKLEAHLAERLGHVQSELVAHIGTRHAEYDEAEQRRFVDVGGRVVADDGRIAALDSKEKAAKLRLAALTRELKLVASNKVRQKDIDDAPHLRILRRRIAPEPIAAPEVEQLVMEWLGRAGVAESEFDFTLMGRASARHWTVTTAGAPQTAAQRRRGHGSVVHGALHAPLLQAINCRSASRKALLRRAPGARDGPPRCGLAPVAAGGSSGSGA